MRLKYIRTFFDKGRNVTACACIEKIITVDKFLNLRTCKRVFSCFFCKYITP